jgi:hypothetical protein
MSPPGCGRLEIRESRPRAALPTSAGSHGGWEG